MDNESSFDPDKVDFAGASVKELTILAERVEQAIATRREERAVEMLSHLARSAEEEGMDLQDVLARSSKGATRRTTLASVRYRNPEKPEEMWSGRGRKPRWLVAYEEGGGDIERLKVEPESGDATS